MPGYKNRKGIPILTMSESVHEIKKRTNIPEELVYKVLWAYYQIAREALCEEVEVQFGDMGFLSWMETKQRLNANWYDPRAKERVVRDFPSYNKIKFRPTNKFKKELRESTTKPIVREEGEENGVGQ